MNTQEWIYSEHRPSNCVVPCAFQQWSVCQRLGHDSVEVTERCDKCGAIRYMEIQS